jgi:hypothetical protein
MANPAKNFSIATMVAEAVAAEEMMAVITGAVVVATLRKKDIKPGSFRPDQILE